MKLLFDQNLSFRLATLLADRFPGSSQARLLGLDRADDRTLWRYAGEHGYALVTHDADFRDLAAMLGSPPKVVLLRCGNQPTAVIEALLRSNAADVVAMSHDTAVDLLEIG